MYKYSFVIPTYNSKINLRNTLEALNCQQGFGVQDYEVIVADDGSSDGTWEYIKDTAVNYELKYIYIERDSGACRSRTRNYGWKAARGEVIIFIDSDIIVNKNYLSALDRYYKADKNFVILGLRLLLPKGVVIDLDTLFEAYRFNPLTNAFLETRHFIVNCLSYNASFMRLPGYLLSSCNAAIPKKYLQAVDGFDEDFKGWGFEDTDLGCRLQLLKEPRFALCSKLDVLHQFHEREENMKEQHDYNRKLFIEKHPGDALDIPVHRAFKFWDTYLMAQQEYPKLFSFQPKSPCQTAVLDFKKAESLDRLKEDITRLSAQEDVEILVNDYVETTDLDIWIQLLGVRNSTPRYHPASRMLQSSSPSTFNRRNSVGYFW